MTNNTQAQTALAAATNGIHQTLRPFIFEGSEENAALQVRDFEAHLLPDAAVLVYKLAGVLMLAYCYLLRSKRPDENIPPAIYDCVMQAWEERGGYSELRAASILQLAADSPPSSSISNLVHNPEVHYRWGDLLRAREDRYRLYLNKLEEVDIYDCFTQLILSLPILAQTSFDGDGFKFPEFDDVVPKFPYLYRSNKYSGVMFLNCFKQALSQPLVVYRGGRSDYREDLRLSDDQLTQYDFMREVLGFKERRQTRSGIVHLFGHTYKPFENLARVIAKTRNDAAVKAFVAQYEGQISVSGGHPLESEELMADFVTLALAELGPTKVLRSIIRHGWSITERYLEGLEKLGVCKASEWEGKLEQRVREKKISLMNFLQLAPTFKVKVFGEIELDSRCWCLLNAAGLVIDSPSDYFESIGTKIETQKTFNAQFHPDDFWSVGVRTARLIERTLKFLIAFYSGLHAYYRSWQSTTTDDFGTFETAMIKEAGRAYHSSRLTPGQLIGRFREMCNDKEYKRVAEKLLGRDTICDVDEFKRFTEENLTSVADELSPSSESADETANLVDMINKVKHDKGWLKPEDVRRFLDQTLQLLVFLRDGQSLDQNLSVPDRLCQSLPVYPAVVSFREQHRKRDGLVVSNYKVYSHDWDVDEDSDDPTRVASLNIKIFSPREYTPNEDYYCIPFHKRTTPEWLLDPFLISCSKLNSSFK